MFDNKRFQNNESQEVIMVMGESGAFFSLSNGSNIKKDIFFQKFTEVVDTSNFFNTSALINELAGKINQIDPSKVPEIGGGTTIRDLAREQVSEQMSERDVIHQQPTMNKEEMIRRFQEEQSRKDLSQYKVYDDDEQAIADFESKIQRPPEPTTRRRELPEGFSEDGVMSVPAQQINQQQLSKEEESFRFFRSFKRIYPITLDVDFDEKIADPMFIKMMAMNYEGDIIKFYTKEIMNRVYNDPGYLENKVYDKLKTLILGEPKPIKPKRISKPKEILPTPTEVIKVKKSPKPKKEV